MGIFGYFGEFFSGILVYHFPPWPTLNNDMMTESVVLMLLWPRARFSQSFKNTSREKEAFHFSHHSHSLLFDLNYKFIHGNSLLALAKSIY